MEAQSSWELTLTTIMHELHFKPMETLPFGLSNTRPRLQKLSVGHISQTFEKKQDFGCRLLLLWILKATKNEAKHLLHFVWGTHQYFETKLSKSVISAANPMALFHYLIPWQQPYEPFPIPETYLNLSSVSIPSYLPTSLASHFSFMIPIWLLLSLDIF